VLSFAGRRGLIAGSWLQIIPLSAAALAYGLATALGGSGFIAAFVAGILFGQLTDGQSEAAGQLNEEIGELLAGVTFLIFGAALLGPTLQRLTWQIVLYAVASLTVVRMLPVALAMIGSRARSATIAFLGWFGPRGLASIVFTVIVIQEAHLPGIEPILLSAYATIGLSVFAHGITAAPLASAYSRWYEAHPRDRRPTMESVPVAHHRPRGGLTAGRREVPDVVTPSR
jgi:NhaP-type Na+/H+ or K+/H+ antiporter